MKNRSIAIATAAIALLAVGGVSVMSALAQGKPGAAQPAPRAKIGPVEAIKIALGKQPGRPLNANFEFDEGHWVYGVMIVHNHKLTEVEIDPLTGKVGDAEEITPAGEAKEAEQELSAAIK